MAATAGGVLGKIPGVGAVGRAAGAATGLASKATGAVSGLATKATGAGAGRIGGMLGGIGRGISGFTAGMGRAVSSALRGLASGISALGRPAVLRGLLAMTAMVVPLYLSAKAFKEFNTVDWESMAKAGLALGAIGGTIALVGRKVGATEVRGAAMFAAAVGAIGLGMLVAGEGLKTFNDVNWESMAKAGIAIAVLAGAAALAGSGPQAAAIALGGLAIGGAIGAIGAGIAGAAWLLGNTLPDLINGIKGFEQLDGQKLKDAAVGMAEISGALVLMTGGSIVSGLGGLVSSFANLFTEDPVSKLKRFAEIGPPLRIAADSMRVFSEVMPTAVDALNRISISRNAVDALDRFKDMFGTGWFTSRISEEDLQGGIFAILRKFSQEQDVVRAAVSSIGLLSGISVPDSIMQNLQKMQDIFRTGFFSSRISEEDLQGGIFVIFSKFAEQRTTIELAVEAINRLSQIDLSGVTKLRDLFAISSSIGPRSISNLSALVSNPQFVQSLQGLMSAVQTAAPAAAPVSAGAGTGGGAITVDQLNLETIQYYNVTKAKFTEMADTLLRMLDTLNVTKDNSDRGFRDLETAVARIRGI